MKEKILKLRKEGKSFNEISDLLGCSKGTVSYHCGKGQKEKTALRREKRRRNPLVKKFENFKYGKAIKETIRKFQKSSSKIKGRVDKTIRPEFTLEDVLVKFGKNPICYLSGELLDLKNGNFSFDHIIPVSRGGDNSLKNLGLTSELVNRMKTNMTPNELIEMCVKILKYNGFQINGTETNLVEVQD